MLIDDIQMSAKKMSHEELRQKIEEIRANRVQSVKQIEKKEKKTKTTKKRQGASLAKKLGMTKEQIIEALYGNEEN